MRPALAVAAVIPAVTLLAACGGSAEGEAAVVADDLGEPRDVYTTRGEVVALPRGGPQPRDLLIYHEEIPGFLGAGGDAVGMAAMQMPFPRVAPGVELDRLEPGDKVSFELKVRWDGASPVYWIDNLEELPAETPLELPGG